MNGSLYQAFCFNITWSLRRGKILPKLEFFPWVLSFILEFRFFTEVFSKNCSKVSKIEDFCFQNSCSWKYLWLKIAKQVPRPLKKDQNWLFSLSFLLLGEMPPGAWVFFLSFWLEFCAWVLVFLAAGVKKKSLTYTLGWGLVEGKDMKYVTLYSLKCLSPNAKGG